MAGTYVNHIKGYVLHLSTTYIREHVALAIEHRIKVDLHNSINQCYTVMKDINHFGEK